MAARMEFHSAQPGPQTEAPREGGACAISLVGRLRPHSNQNRKGRPQVLVLGRDVAEVLLCVGEGLQQGADLLAGGRGGESRNPDMGLMLRELAMLACLRASTNTLSSSSERTLHFKAVRDSCFTTSEAKVSCNN